MEQQSEVIDPRGRASSGKFVKGHSFKSPGRPPKPKVEDVNYLGLLRQAMTADEALAIIRQAIVDARKGSRHARTWLFKHLMPEFPRVNQHEFALTQQQQANFDSADARPYIDVMDDSEFRMFMRVIDRMDRIRLGELVKPNGWTCYVPPDVAKKIALGEMTPAQAKPFCEGRQFGVDDDWLKEELAKS